MASPEVNVAALGSSGSRGELSAFESLSGVLRGWKKKVTTKKTGALKRKDVSYLSPNGEEIKSRHQLLKYLKAHPGILKPGDFCWTSAEPPRRSLRLNRKGRHIRFEELELLPTKRRKRNNGNNANNGNENNTAPARPGRGRPKSAGTSQKPPVTGTEESILAVKLEPVEEAEHVTEQPSIPTPQPVVVATPVLQSEEADEPKMNNSYQEVNNPELNLEGKHQEKEHTLLTEDVNRDNMEEELPSAGTDEQAITGLSPAAEEAVALVEDIPVDEEQTIAAKPEANGLPIARDAMEEVTSIVPASDTLPTKLIAAKPGLIDNSETDQIHVGNPEAEGNFICGRVPDLDEKMEEPADHQVVESAVVVSVEDSTIVDQILKEDILNFISESEPLDHHQEVSKANLMDVDAFVKDTTISLEVRELEAEVKCKAVDSPQPQGIHALVDDLLAFGGKAKSLEYEVTSQTSLENMVTQTMMEPVSVLE